MVRISACVITKNEAMNIARCLQSVKSIANELIVVDTGSTDDTVKIAHERGAKVFPFTWVNDFSAARNYALDQAKGDWIIFLDADEYIVAEKARHLRPVIEKADKTPAIEALTCVMEHTDGFDGPLRARDRTVRIFRNSPAIRFQGRIHEFIRKHDRFTQSAHLDESAIVIRHTGYTPDKRAAKMLRNHRLLEETLNDGSATGMTYYYLSHSFWAMRQYDKAVEFARKAIDDGMIESSIFAHRVYCVLIQSMLQVAVYREEDVAPLVATALEKYPHHPEVLKTRGYYLRRFGHYTQAIEALLQSLAANERYDDITLSNEFLMNNFRVHWEIAHLYELMNDAVKALDHYVTAVKLKKDEAEAFDSLVTLLRPQKAADIVGLLNSLYDLKDEADVGFVVTRLAALREKEVFAYYEKIWAERFGHKEYTAVKFLLSGHYAQATPLFAAAFRESGDRATELMVVVASLLGGQPPATALAERELHPAFQQIGAAFLQPATAGMLTPEDFAPYLEVVKNALRLGGEDDFRRLLAIGLLFPVADAPAQIAALLESQRLYRQAITMYGRQIEQSGAGPAGELYCRAGFCCYKLKDYEAAAVLFAQAWAGGFRGHELGEYLAWSYRQCKVSWIKDKLAAVQACCEDGAAPTCRVAVGH